jgi:hypothetical protein
METNDPKEKAHLAQDWPTDMLHTTLFGSPADFQMLLEVEASQGLSNRREHRMKQRVLAREIYLKALHGVRWSLPITLQGIRQRLAVCRWVQSLLHPQKPTKTKQPN